MRLKLRAGEDLRCLERSDHRLEFLADLRTALGTQGHATFDLLPERLDVPRDLVEPPRIVSDEIAEDSDVSLDVGSLLDDVVGGPHEFAPEHVLQQLVVLEFLRGPIRHILRGRDIANSKALGKPIRHRLQRGSDHTPGSVQHRHTGNVERRSTGTHQDLAHERDALGSSIVGHLRPPRERHNGGGHHPEWRPRGQAGDSGLESAELPRGFTPRR